MLTCTTIPMKTCTIRIRVGIDMEIYIDMAVEIELGIHTYQ